MYGYRGPVPPSIRPYPPTEPPFPGAPGEPRYPIDEPHAVVPPYIGRHPAHFPPREPMGIRDGPPGEEDFPLIRKERRPPPPPNPYDYAPRRGRSRSPRHRGRPRSKTPSRSRSRSFSQGRSKKSKRKGKKKGKRSRSSSSSSSSSDSRSRSRSRSGSPNAEYSKWLDVIKKMDSKDASIASTAVLPPSVIAKLTAAGLWPPPGQVNPFPVPGPSAGVPPYFPGQPLPHTPSHPVPTGVPPVSVHGQGGSSVAAPIEEKKENAKEVTERKEETEEKESKQKGPGLTPEQLKKLTEQRDKFKNAQDMIIAELFQLQFSHAELLAKMFAAESSDEVSSHSGLITENMKLQNEMLTKLKDINKVVLKCSEALKETNQSADLIRTDVQYFDPKNHFCGDCKIFCDSASDYLEHSTTVLHKKFAKCNEDTPWRKEVSEESGEKKNLEKVAPLKGLPFILPVEAFYCKLCDVWVGDKQDTLKHLISTEHNNKYLRFAVDNPEWETEHVQKRQKAAKTTIKQGFEKRTKAKEETAQKEVKKEKREEKEKSQERKTKPEKRHDEVDLTSGGRSIRVNMRESVAPKREVTMEPSKNNGKDSLVEAWAGAKKVDDAEAFAALRNKLRKKMDSPPRLPPKVEPKTISVPLPPPKNGGDKHSVNMKPFFIGKMPIKKVHSKEKSPSPKKQKSPERGASSRRDNQSKNVGPDRKNSECEILFPPLSPKNIYPQLPPDEHEEEMRLLGIGRDDIAAGQLRRKWT